MVNCVYDLIGIGLGPFNLGLAALLEPITEIKSLFLEQKPQFQWHPGLLLEGTTIQVPFLADLVTMAEPSSKFSFLSYLKAKSRLYNFYFWEEFHIPRREYNDYCQWVAKQLPNCYFGEQVKSIDWDEKAQEFIVSGTNFIYRCRNLVLGVGTVPYIPPCFRDLVSENVFHSSKFLHQKVSCRQAKSITVIGSGQSAAEVFYELLQEQENYDYHLEWHTRSSGFFPMEYSKLGLEHFSPDYIHYFYHLQPEQRDELLTKQGLLYKGISFNTIAKIYDLLYERSVADNYPDVKLLSGVEVKDIEPTAEGYRLTYRHSHQHQPFIHESDRIILATGYHHATPNFMADIRDLLQWDEKGRYKVNFDYHLSLTQDIPNRIFVQNAELHTHGIGAPDLGLGCYRNSVIINSLTGRNTYPVQQRNVFQQFGLVP
ncbi:lysine N(6)-hydroxylase/L-ornithine N(5)-oxygenase family protein [Anabaena sp. FACHB-709]|uniref:L-lysine N6-monooxygenase MbtG n=2 Tax=Nostocaceae TaxID=1162 RepID=A0A1Z4KQY8_ANAVA|nr:MULTISPECIES: lysine N(6)-hydroxylase/L-ornithine N(5)-oxygenase family protein [Nostocaceae]BAY71357.1 putative monooxygenase [Trichormus variabilis NIES-23]HBW30166.1 lysine 6-monooxygenase [Nostoc sp. UBA8866]MBD2172043.1 lysine N(6)-hydroxylase/L-ornithine N(5)-oxygenase family protein [Anabaena cylindrica FACHB-318]MBD2263766.1 lysine N(6)-hydroxylase/L-ornithine N(5)-oxygenase family protein [Anabaena sp. FACHB-709]MBD2274966.1 lysine N(6)-hydroxylase/L-ornithine N(5)-oxygenase family